MTVTAVRKDPDALTMTLTAEFEASPERVWELWADPRQLERWWGPPTWPATFTAHDLAPGGHVEYHMTGPTGDQPRGYWDVVEADPPRRLVFLDGFAHDDGTPNDDFPRNEGRVTIEPIDAGRTRMSIDFHYDEHSGDGAVPRHGHAGRSHAGGRPDRRDPGHGRSRTMTTMIEPTTHTLDVPGAVLTYDVRRARLAHRPGARRDRVADGRQRLRHAGRPLHRSHRGDLRPARRRAQHQGRSRQPVHARRARRRPASAHRRARTRDRSTCSPAAVARSTRWPSWRGTRSRSGPLSRTSRRSPRSCPIAKERWRPPRRSTTPTCAAGSAPAWRSSSSPLATRDRWTPTSSASRRPDPAMFGLPTEDDGNRTDPLLGQNMPSCTHYELDFDALRAASTRIVMAAGRGVGRPDGVIAARSPWPSGSARRP